MNHQLKIFNSLTGEKEVFVPLHENNVGMYVCGPTVYSNVHLGNVRTFMSFDFIYRTLKFLGYKVRYVRNITDAGHLTDDGDVNNDRFVKQSRLEKLEPMEIVQKYTVDFHKVLEIFNLLPPTIEPTATGHILEQIQLTEKLLKDGFAYESNGSIYFDIAKYNQTHRYGILSGRNLEDVLDASRQLDGVGEKRNQADFALWKHAQPEHIMRWPSPWGEGFPGWHCECTAMGRKYLGNQFDIHGGGMDLIFPHHECEIAQAVAAEGEQMVHYWMHNNMITINGQKMGKSLGNFITLEQFFNGSHPSLEKAYSPMTIRFFILSAHYRGTVDFSNEALQASEKGLERLLNGIADLQRIQPAKASDEATATIVNELPRKCYDAMNDDFQTPMVLSHLFEACHVINSLLDHKAQISAEHLEQLAATMRLFAFQLLGLNPENGNNNDAREEAFGQVVDMVLDLRAKAKADKDWATSDRIRDELASAGFEVKDTKDGATWKLNK